MSAVYARLSATLDSRQDRAILRRLTPSNFDPAPTHDSDTTSNPSPSTSRLADARVHSTGPGAQPIARAPAGPAPTAPTAAAKGKGRMVDFSSNDYLSLSTNTTLKRRFVQAFVSSEEGGEGLSPYGPPSSRLLDGNSREHEALERQLVNFLKSDDQICCQTLEEPVSGLLFNSGFDANLSIFSTLPAPSDYILYDSLIHASTHDGMRTSRVPQHNRRPFGHSSTADLVAHLSQIIAADPEVRAGQRAVWIAVEALYSMDGDWCPLREMVEAVEGLLPRGNGMFVVDEAHSTGLFGGEGRGLVSGLGLEERVAVRVATFGKAVACSGAIVLAHPVVRHFLINYARPLIYSTAMPRMNVVAVRQVFRHLESGGADQARTHVHALSHLLTASLSDFVSISSPHVRLFQSPPTSATCLTPSTSPIVPLLTPASATATASENARALAAHLQALGLLVRPITYPTVPRGKERVRVCLHAGNAEGEVERLVGGIRRWVKGEVEKARQGDGGKLRAKL